MRVEEIEKKAEELAEKLAKKMGYYLVDVEWKFNGKRGLLRIYIDKNGGITVRDCERFSRAFSDILDAEDFIEFPYILEVSSPGLDRKLVKPREINWALGKNVRIVLKNGETLKGKLNYYNEEENVIGVDDNFFNFSEVAILQLDWERR
jgi:Uncharacterized protein conserved in bacteria